MTNPTQPKALYLADVLSAGFECDMEWYEIEAARELRRLHFENARLVAVLREAEYALNYASDMTKPEGLSGCDCPICTVTKQVTAAIEGVNHD